VAIDNRIRYNYLGDEATASDCPIFDNMWDYFRLYSGASLDGARNLVADQSDIAINWSGGLHHAHKNRAAGFCYINDIVLAIQLLLLTNTRVLYIDIDVHHGDGVEEAFFSTDRVLTLSFHNYWNDFFPGTGSMTDVGPKDPSNPGAHHSLNVPLRPGITDEQWTTAFEQTTAAVIQNYDPSAIVLQCGADSLGGDRLGQFNVSIKAHGNCVDFVKKHCHNRKLLIVGGGGYTPRNVARCWTHETALCVEAELNNSIPAHVPYRQAFIGTEHGSGLLYPDFTAVHKNENQDGYLNGIVCNVEQQLRYMQGAPSVEMKYIPVDYIRVRREQDERMREEREVREQDEARRHMEERNLGAKNELRGP
jgi:histone deacetylase HOS2